MEYSLMSQSNFNGKRLMGILVSPVGLIRLSSILTILDMVGHTSAFPWTSTHGLQEIQLVDSMKAVKLEFWGNYQSYWNLYFGWGVFIAVLLLTLSIVLWLLSDLARLAPRRLGVTIGAITAFNFVGAYIAFHFFFLPPFLLFLAIGAILLTATVRLLRQPPIYSDARAAIL
jgi:hypothetical protein